MKKRRVKSQTFLEYAILIAIVAGMLVAMRVYMTRAVQEKYRQSADVYGEGEQYAKGITQATNLDNPGTTIPELDPAKPQTCQEAKASVSNLESEIKDLKSQADSMLQSAAETEKSLPMLQQQADALTAQAGQNDAWGRDERKTAADLTAQADDKQKQVDDYKKNYVSCFSGGCTTSCADGDNCCCILDTVTQLEPEIASLRQQVQEHTSRAEGYEAKAQELHAQADSLNGSILKLKEQISNLRAQADDFQNKINAKQAQIDKFKSDFPSCF